MNRILNKALKAGGLTVFFLLLCASLFAQKRKKSPVYEGDRHYRKHEYLTAIPFLEQAVREDSTKAKPLFQLGACYSQRYHKAKAIHLIEKAYSINQKVDKNFFYWYGKALQNESKFDQAKNSYARYLLDAKKKKNPLYILAQKHLIECEHALSIWHKNQDFMVRIIGSNVNTKYSEHRPVIAPDDSLLYFTSTRQSKYLHDLNVGFIENTYSTIKKSDGEWATAQWVDSLLHLTLNDAVCQLFDNGNKMLLFHTSNNGDVYFSNKKDGKWAKPHRFPHINSNSFESDACMTEDGKQLFFASNKGTKYADLDLFVSQRTGDSTWSDPVNLGITINTTEHEGSPYVTPDSKTLYFSSKGHSSIGGYDVFRSKWHDSTNTWSEPENIGIPVNTPGDDMFFSLSKEGNKGYYVSYRESGFGESDIFEVVRKVKIPYESKIFSKDSLFEFRGLSLILEKYEDNVLVDKKEVKGNKTIYSDSIQIGYDYKVFIINGMDTVFKDAFTLEYVPKGNQLIKNFYVDIKDEDMIGKAYYKGMRVPDLNSTYIYYKFNNYKPDSKAVRKIEKVTALLKKFPFLKINITSYSNDLKTDNKSQELSEERAQNIFEEIVRQGISEDRLKTRHKGIALRKTKSQTAQQKKFNRRTEIKLTR